MKKKNDVSFILEQFPDGRKRIILQEPGKENSYDELLEEGGNIVSRFFAGVKKALRSSVGFHFTVYTVALIWLYWMLFHNPMCQPQQEPQHHKQQAYHSR